MIALTKHWLPGQPINEQTMAEATWLDQRYWHNTSVAISNGIAKAFKG
ncbi:MAG: DUF6890 family protein [Methylobacter sp.]